MCLEDYKIGKRIKTRTRTVSLGQTSAQVVASAPKRVLLIFSGEKTTGISVMQGQTAVEGEGFFIPAASGVPLAFCFTDTGDLASREFSALCTAGTGRLTITEGFLDDDL